MQTKPRHLIALSILFHLLFTTISHADGGHHQSDAEKSGKKHHWEAPEEEANRQNPTSGALASIQRGKVIFRKSCAICHGKEAKGDGPAATTMNPKPSDLSMMAGMHSDGEFAWKIATGKGAMPGMRDSLTEDQIWDVVSFIQSLKPDRMEPHSGQ